MSKSKSSESKGHIVCLVTNDLITDQRMQRICSTLADNRWQVTLVGRYLPDSPPLKQQAFHQVRLKCWFNKGFAFYAEYNIRLFFWLMANAFSIVCAIDLDTIIPAWKAARMKGKKVVYDAHEWFPECPEIVDRPFVYHFWSGIEKMFVPRMDAIYTVSQSIADVFEEMYGKPVHLVRNMPMKEQHPSVESSGYILYQGALNEGRGLEAMIAAMTSINKELWLAGAGDIQDSLKQLTSKLHLDDKVKFLGRLEPAALKEITQSAWLGINVLENKGKNYYFSLANKFFDYVQAGVPQISMAFPEYQRMNQTFEVACLISELSAEAIQQAIHRLEDENYYHHLQSNAIEASKIWNWENESKVLISVYEQLGG